MMDLSSLFKQRVTWHLCGNNVRNIFIETEFAHQVTDAEFYYFFGNDPIIRLQGKADLLDVLVASGLFPSRSQARKNIVQQNPKDWVIPFGFTELSRDGKKPPLAIFVFKPMECLMNTNWGRAVELKLSKSTLDEWLDANEGSHKELCDCRLSDDELKKLFCGA